jgi:hypothetical protein
MVAMEEFRRFLVLGKAHHRAFVFSAALAWKTAFSTWDMKLGVEESIMDGIPLCDASYLVGGGRASVGFSVGI